FIKTLSGDRRGRDYQCQNKIFYEGINCTNETKRKLHRYPTPVRQPAGLSVVNMILSVFVQDCEKRSGGMRESYPARMCDPKRANRCQVLNRSADQRGALQLFSYAHPGNEGEANL